MVKHLAKREEKNTQLVIMSMSSWCPVPELRHPEKGRCHCPRHQEIPSKEHPTYWRAVTALFARGFGEANFSDMVSIQRMVYCNGKTLVADLWWVFPRRLVATMDTHQPSADGLVPFVAHRVYLPSCSCDVDLVVFKSFDAPNQNQCQSSCGWLSIWHLLAP